jgi:Ca-activated chloride channel family protein
VGQVYRRLFGPVLTEPVLDVVDASGEIDTRAVREQQPGQLPDLYSDDQLVVAGRYLGPQALTFRLRGRGARGDFEERLRFDPGHDASPANSFVPRLWASRRIAELVDEVRQAGATPGQPLADARLQELVQEIVQLSTHYGVLTEYTAFMATEGTDLSNLDTLHKRLRGQLAQRAQKDRTGRGAVSQSVNLSRMRHGSAVDRTNAYLDANMDRVALASVQQVDDLALFHIGGGWVDSRIIEKAQSAWKEAKEKTLESATQVAAAAGLAPAAPSAGAKPKPVKLDAATVAGLPFTAQVLVEYDTPEYARFTQRMISEGRQGVLALKGDLFLLIDGMRTLVLEPGKAAPAIPGMEKTPDGP